MNKYLHKFGAILMVSAISIPVWALDEVDGVYQIGSEADYIEFAGIVNGGEKTANAVLTADLSFTELTQVGTGGYAGTFDGQGHTITFDVDYISTSQEYVAPFYQLDPTGVIQNLNVAGTMKSGGKYMAGFVARLAGGKVSHCTSTLTLYTSVSGDCTNGGVAGLTSSNDGSVIEYCIIGGAFEGSLANSWGGLIGWSNQKVTIDNCLFIADISGTQSSEQTWGRNSSTVTVTNSIYLNVLGSANGGTQVTAEQLQSGEACFILNGRSSENPSWYQNIGTDALPTTDPTHAKVFLNGHLSCDGMPVPGEATYSNTEGASTQDDHNFVDGVCTVCGTASADFVPQGEDGYYNISNGSQLLWFASTVNDGNPALNARLTAPIDLEGIEWVPIGNTVVTYQGTFEGQLYPITNIGGMLFGTVDGAQISGIAIESGEVTANIGAAHTGSIIGHSTSTSTSLTNSYSKAFINGGEGDLGGIAGKFQGTMKNVAFEGNFADWLGTWSMGGLIGSSNTDGGISISDCFVFTEWPDALDRTYGARGGLVGWCHTNTVSNSYVVADTFSKFFGDGTGSTSNCAFLTAEEFASGALAWKLNGENFADVLWYQTISDDPEQSDPYPVLDATHEIVYPTTDGYASAGPDNFDEMRDNLIAAELAYCENVVANIQTKADYVQTLNDMKGISDRDAFIQAYQDSKAVRAVVEASENAYADYKDFVEKVSAMAQESSIQGEDMELLDYYINFENVADEDFPNGTYIYIINTQELDNEQLAAEMEFVDALWQKAQKNGYTVGDEITNMLTNPNFADGFNGWTYTKEGSTLTTGGVPEVMPTAESWNATFDLNQTITGLSDGYYKLQVNAAFRSASDLYSTNYAAWTYINGDETLVMTEGEDVVTEDDARDLENCYINGGVLIDEEGNHISPFDYEYNDFDNDIFGYVPYGPLSCSYAFSAGRYVNTIVTHVTDGNLTVGLRLPGTGQAQDWMGFGNFRLTYLGDEDTEYTSSAYDETLAGMVARANTLLAYVASSANDYGAKPQFSTTLRAQLSSEIADVAAATTTAQKEALVARFAETFRSIYSCKKAYINYFDRAQALYSAGYAMAEDDPDLYPLLLTYQNVLENVFVVKWENGDYTQADAEEMADIKATDLYKYLNDNMPDIVDGKYQIATADHLLWFARMVNGGDSSMSAEQTASIDLADVDWTPIGTMALPFTGSYDGHLYPITNINNMLFGTISGASITRVALESGEITSINTQYADQTGSIVGYSPSSSASLTNSYSRVKISGGSGDLGGIAGKYLGTLKNVAYLGGFSARLSSWTIGGLLGSTNSTNTTFVSDCFVFADWEAGLDPTYGARGGLVGWCHTNTVKNSYVIADTFTKLLGDGTGSIEECGFKTADEYASGAIAVLLNSYADQDGTVWYQNLGRDAYPVLDETHLEVFVDADGNYYNDGTGLKRIDSDTVLPAIVNVYDMQGRVVRSGVSRANALEGLPKGLYVVGGKKTLK